MGKDNPQPPPAPDPAATVSAQTDANIKAAQATAALNRVNQTNPQGSSTWSQDPATGQWSQSTTLDPTAQYRLGQADYLSTTAGNAIPYNKPLQYGVSPASLQTSFSAGGPLSTVTNNGVPVSGVNNPGVPVGSVGSGGPIQSGLNLNGVQPIPTADHAALARAIDATYGQATSRLDPQWQKQQTELETQLANQGVPQNSDAWNRAMSEFQRNKTDAYSTAENQAVLTGNQVEQNQFGMGLAANQAGVGNAATAGTFANTAQGQKFGEGVTQGSFANSAAGQALAQALAAGGFSNSAAGQKFGQDVTAATTNNAAAGQKFAQDLTAGQAGNAAKQQEFGNSVTNANLNNASSVQNLQDLLAQLNLPSSISMPNFSGIPSANVGAPDVLGAQSLSTQAQLAQYQQQMQNQSAKKGGTGSLLGTAAMAAALASDRRVKRNIRPVGIRINGFPVYRFKYIWGGPEQIGFMAQDVEKTRPHAVLEIQGVKHVDYALALAA